MTSTATPHRTLRSVSTSIGTRLSTRSWNSSPSAPTPPNGIATIRIDAGDEHLRGCGAAAATATSETSITGHEQRCSRSMHHRADPLVLVLGLARGFAQRDALHAEVGEVGDQPERRRSRSTTARSRTAPSVRTTSAVTTAPSARLATRTTTCMSDVARRRAAVWRGGLGSTSARRSRSGQGHDIPAHSAPGRALPAARRTRVAAWRTASGASRPRGPADSGYTIARLAAQRLPSARAGTRAARPATRPERNHQVGNTTLVTGGSGYIGALLVQELRDARTRRARARLAAARPGGHRRRAGAGGRRGDPRATSATPTRAAAPSTAPRRSCTSPRSSATPPARCDPERLRRRQRAGHARRSSPTRARRACERLVFASTCSNYGRMADPTVPITEEGELRAGVAVRRAEGRHGEADPRRRRRQRSKPTCLRFATVYGVGRRMRFDLTVNEFTRELWADRELEVFGEQFWRPYIHVRDAGRAVRTVLEAPAEKVAGNVFNAGRSGENYRKLDLVEEIGRQIDRGQGLLRQARRGPARLQGQLRQDPRGARLRDADDGSRRDRRDHRGARRGGVRRPVRRALQEHPLSVTPASDRPMASTETFPELPLFDLQLQPQDLEAVAETLRSGWLTLGPAHGGVRGGVRRAARARATRSRSPAARRRCTSPTSPRGVGPGDEVIVPSFTFAATAAAALYCGATPVFAEIVSRKNPSLDPDDVERRITPRTKAVCAVHYAGYAAAVDRLKELCDGHGIALIEDVAHAPSATLRRAQARHVGPGGRVQLLLQQGPVGRRGRPAVHRRRRGRRVRALAPLARDDERHLGPPQRPHRHLRRGRASASTTASTSRARRCCSRAWGAWRRKSSAGAS